MTVEERLKADGRCTECGCRRLPWGPREIMAAFQAWASKHGEAPAAHDWRRGTHDHPSDSTVRRMFGTWNHGLRLAGLEPRRSGIARGQTSWTRAGMEHALLVWVFERGGVPEWRDWNGTGNTEHPSSKQVEREYGSWNAFIVAAGYEPRRAYRSTESYARQAGAALRARDEHGRLIAA